MDGTSFYNKSMIKPMCLIDNLFIYPTVTSYLHNECILKGMETIYKSQFRLYVDISPEGIKWRYFKRCR